LVIDQREVDGDRLWLGWAAGEPLVLLTVTDLYQQRRGSIMHCAASALSERSSTVFMNGNMFMY
jgi:hypothetical protein